MQTLVEDFLQFLRHERGQSEHTQKTYKALLDKFVTWAETQKITDWKAVEFKHLMAFLTHERERPVMNGEKKGPRKLSSESVYLEIAALRAFYRFAENEKILPLNVAENLSLPRRWKRLPQSLNDGEITRLLKAEGAETPQSLCDTAILELAYASGLRLAELRNVRLEQLHLDAGFINVIGKGNKEASRAGRQKSGRGDQSLPGSRTPEAGHAEIAGKPFFDEARHAVRGADDVAAHQAEREARGHRAQHPRRTCCGIVLPRTCLSTARTCASSRSCSATRASARRRSTPTWRGTGCVKCTANSIRAAERAQSHLPQGRIFARVRGLLPLWNYRLNRQGVDLGVFSLEELRRRAAGRGT